MNITEQLKDCLKACAEGGCKHIAITHAKGDRTCITNRSAIDAAMAALKDELARQIAKSEGRDAELPKGPLMIVDPKGRFFSSYTNAIPAIVHSFTDDESCAYKFSDEKNAEKVRTALLDALYTFDGQEKVPKDYLRIVEATYRVVS